MRSLPQVYIVGATTGGGAGMPISSELPIGWSVRKSASSILDPEGHSTENGVDPSEGQSVDLDPEAAAHGRDSMIDHAVRLLNR